MCHDKDVQKDTGLNVLHSQQQSRGRSQSIARLQRPTFSSLGKRDQNVCGEMRALLCNVINLHGQKENKKTKTNRSPPLHEALSRAVLTERSQWREGMHMTWLDWRGPDRRWRLH